ncbi:hypothetical protein ACIBI9_18300 [Nonomuraea sp. NPDC050451]|uniref:hypothetical protein n=1 Tax=Nonomuraea sp. NPDC050451 TaxID=3364364 RepID=UPI0037B7D3FB
MRDPAVPRPPGMVPLALSRPDRTPVDRAPQGVRVRRGDYDKPDGMREASKGATRLLLVSSPKLDPARRIKQHLAAVEAAAEGVWRLGGEVAEGSADRR